jgi:hypothetical protein
LCGPTAYSCGDARNRATLTLFNDLKRRYLGTSLIHSWHIRNADLHRDVQMEMVTNEIGKFAKKHEERLLQHVNVEAIQLLDNSEIVRRLKKDS